MRSGKFSSAQGTIEYLVIIAVIVVLSLVVVALFISVSSSPAQQISDSASKLGVVGGISIIETVTDSEGDSLIKLGNNYGDFISLKKITLCDDVENDYGETGEQLVSGDEKIFSLVSEACASGEKSKICFVEIDYTTRDGIDKKESRQIVVSCTQDAVASDDEGEVVTPFTGCSPNSVASLEGYTNVDDCSDILGTGNYLLTQDMTCNITINANDININGNYCTLNGNINGSGDEYGESGYDFNLYNITASAISSEGVISLIGGNSGNGGLIAVVNSSVASISADGADANDTDPGQFGYPGNGGNIILTDSNVSGAVSSNGGSGYFGFGNRGVVSLNGSIVDNIISIGDNGSVSVSDSIVDSINVTGAGGSFPNCASGGTVTSSNGSVIGSITANGGNTYNGACGGGTINLSDTEITSITATGGEDIMGDVGGNGGDVILTNITGISSVIINGTSGINSGGNGGDVNFSPCPSSFPTLINGGGTPDGVSGTVTPNNCPGYYD